MTRRHIIFVAMISVLLGMNLWYWWPHARETHRMAASSYVRRFQVEDFELKVPTGAEKEDQRSRRNLFLPKVSFAQLSIKKTNNPPAPPPKTPEQLEEDAARAELAQIKLVGVVFRGDRGQAFLTEGEKVFLASEGDKVGERFTVETIATYAVQLKDPKTNVT